MRPKLILFDYGNTLLSEPGYDTLRGEEALFKYIKSNPRGVTPRAANDFAQEIFGEIRKARKLGFELHETQYLKLLYESLDIEFTIPYDEVEEVFGITHPPAV